MRCWFYCLGTSSVKGKFMKWRRKKLYIFVKFKNDSSYWGDVSKNNKKTYINESKRIRKKTKLIYFLITEKFWLEFFFLYKFHLYDLISILLLGSFSFFLFKYHFHNSDIFCWCCKFNSKSVEYHSFASLFVFTKAGGVVDVLESRIHKKIN